jgi:hypothetical protein
MAAKKMIWRQQPGIDYARQSDALIGAVCRYLNVPTEYPTIEGIAAFLGIEHVEEPEEKNPDTVTRTVFNDGAEVTSTTYLGDENCIPE